MTDTLNKGSTLTTNPQTAAPAKEADAQGHTGNADSQMLAKDWVDGQGNTKSRNFVTPGDEADPRTVEEVFAEKDMSPAFTGKY